MERPDEGANRAHRVETASGAEGFENGSGPNDKTMLANRQL